MVTILIFGFLICAFSYLLLMYGSPALKHSKNFGNNQNEAQKLVQIPQIGLLKGLSWMLFCGRGSISKFLVYVSKIHNIVEGRIANVRFAIINDYELGKELFKNPVFCAKPANAVFAFHSKGDYGIINPCGKKWKEQRKFCQHQLKEFGFGTKAMETLIQNEIEDLIKNWKDKEGEAFIVNKEFYIPIVSSIWVLLAGKRASEQDELLVPLVNNVFDGLGKGLEFPEILLAMSPLSAKNVDRVLTWLPIFSGIKFFQNSCTELRAFFEKLIISRKETLDMNTSPSNFVDAYLIEIRRTTDPESEFFGKRGEMHLVAAMMDFFMAGGDTTAQMLNWAMLHLIRNHDIQEKIFQEVNTAVGKYRRPCLQDRLNCPYTEAFLSELLRFSPIATASMPHVPTEDTSIGPHYITKETFLFLNIYSIHHNPLIWGDPLNFRPERFLTGEGNTLSVGKHEAMCGFSLGQRRCVGEQVARDNLFLFVSAICQRFILKPDPLLKGIVPPLEDQKSAAYVPKAFKMVTLDRFNEVGY